MSRSQQGLYPHRCRPIPHLSWPLLLCVCVRNLRAERFYCVRPIRIVAGVMNTTSPPPSSPKWEIEKKKVDPKNQMRSIIEGRNFDSSSLLPFPLSLSLTTSPLEKKTPDPTKRKRAVPECPRNRLHPPFLSTLSCDSTILTVVFSSTRTNRQTDAIRHLEIDITRAALQQQQQRRNIK